MKVLSYRELEAWQKAMDLVVAIYAVTDKFPREEAYGLTGQLRRAGISIPSNIAEGQGRKSTKDFLHFLFIARGSLYEVLTQIEIACRLGFLDESDHVPVQELAQTTGKLVSGLIRALEGRL